MVAARRRLDHRVGVIRDTLVEVELKEARIGEASAVHYLRSTLHESGPLGSPEPRRRRREDRRLRNLRDSLQPGSSCPACVGQEQHESHALHVLMEVLPEAVWRERLASSDGLCLPHVRLALSDESTAPQLEWLLADQRRRLAALLGDLGEYIRKHDYRFVGEPPGSERDAFERGTAYVAGAWFELPGPARGDGPCT